MTRYDRLSPQAYSVLDEIKYQYGAVFLPRLASNLSIPLASVRRSLSELRSAGFPLVVQNKIVRLFRG
jgi:hypothetical protein